MVIATFLTENKDLLALLLAIYAAVLSTLNFLSPRIKEWRDQRDAIFQALQGDRKAIASISLRVIDGDWDSRLKRDEKFRAKLLRSLAMAVGLEGSDRGKAYVLAALQHVASVDKRFQQEALTQLQVITKTFEKYVETGADPKFEEDRLAPVLAIVQAVSKPPQSSV
jgi:hypothetical protein